MNDKSQKNLFFNSKEGLSNIKQVNSLNQITSSNLNSNSITAHITMALSLFHYQILSLVSGFLITFVFGALYTLGTITPYIASYINYESDPNIYAVDVSILYPTFMVSQMFGIIASMNFLQKFVGYKMICLIGVVGMAFCVFLTSWLKTYSGYVIVYGIMFGFISGLCYLIPMMNCYSYLPKRKGLCSGVCMMAYGLGSLLFNFILLKLINPNNQKPNQSHIFPVSVAENVPSALRYMSAIYIVIGAIGCLLMIPKSTLKLKLNLKDQMQKSKQKCQNSRQQKLKDSILTQNDEQSIESLQKKRLKSDSLIQSSSNHNNEPSQLSTTITQFKTPFSQLLKTHQYRYLILMILTSIPFSMFIAFDYKQYGQTLTTNDTLITITGSLGAISNSFSRIFWCWLYDKSSFKKIQLILNTSQIVYMILIIFVKNQYCYVILIILIYFSYGANFGLFPAQTVKIYGDVNGGRIYPLIFTAVSVASVIQFLFHFFIVKRMGNYFLFYQSQIGDNGFLICFIVFGTLLLVAEVLFFKANFKYYNEESEKISVSEA